MMKEGAKRGKKKEEWGMCAFCRTPPASSNEESIKRIKKRVELDDASAICDLGGYYSRGLYGLPRDQAKSLKLWHRAGVELDHAGSYHNIGNSYLDGMGVERDMEKARHYWELAAIGGNIRSRHNLGVNEQAKCNYDRALQHFTIATGSGHAGSLKEIQTLYMQGHVTKDDYANALRARQAYLDDIKSDLRDKAAAICDGNNYYD